jgi:HlyD family secretion protein
MSLPKKVVPLAVLAAVVAVVFLWRGQFRRNGPPADRVTGNGTIETVEVEVSSRIPGRLRTVAVAEGQDVAAGALVADLDPAELEGQEAVALGILEAARASLRELEAGTRSEELARARAQREAARMAERQARARLALVLAGARPETVEALRAQVRQAEATAADAVREGERIARLVREGALPARESDTADTRSKVAAAALDTARQRLAEAEAGARSQEREEAEAAVAAAAAQAEAAQAGLALAEAGPRRETVAAARARVEQAQGSVEAIRRTLSDTRVLSPMAGTVTVRNAEPGEVVTPGLPIVKLADLGQVWLKVYVSEREVGRVSLGRPAEVSVDAFPGRTFRGAVVEIAQKPEFTPKNVQTREERVKLVFAVKIGVENPSRELKPGMPADASILTSPP